ncbi:MAG: serine/threonine protein kinase [Bdellovibrionales bacterium]|nr:serine/threonine protein kinase [Bdellovibrionales bacterium]
MLEIELGSLFGDRYQITQLVGAGGMGAVYLARHPEDPSKKIAIKVLYPGKVGDFESRERFKNEINALMKVSHPNVVKAYEYFDRDDLQAYVMEFVDSGDLLDRMKQGPLGLKQSVLYLKQIISGLYAVHSAGIIHRDLKPDNILVTSEEVIKLSDFGVARLRGAATLTLVGTMVGTPKYLSPEYVETGNCDHRGDIFAAGVIAYEMISGISPYRSATKVSIIVERLKDEVKSLEEIIPGCPISLSELVSKAMAIDVNRRYQSALNMLADLEKIEKEIAGMEEPIIEVPTDYKSSSPSIEVGLTSIELYRDYVLHPSEKRGLAYGAFWVSTLAACWIGTLIGKGLIGLIYHINF